MRNIRQITVRFNLDNELHKKAWMLLQNMDRRKHKSYSNIVAEAVAAYLSNSTDEPDANEQRIAEVVRDTVRECFAAVLTSEILKSIFADNKTVPKPVTEPVPAEGNYIDGNDIDWEFLGIKNT